VQAVQSAESDAVGAIEGLAGRIRELDGLVDGIMIAVNGADRDGSRIGGLSRLAELLRAEVLRFSQVVRDQ
jgi:hypothetical protein